MTDYNDANGESQAKYISKARRLSSPTSINHAVALDAYFTRRERFDKNK